MLIKNKLCLCILLIFLTTIRITLEGLRIKFSSILIGPKKFYRQFKKNFSKKSKNSVVYK
ncbi:hypothetical protein FWK35_00007014 [Aphis craccivora]|uniref:Uncharacterized protein n=1 Tax=Aphis craccivora TaxID=307492 RepID=A0A6G0Z7F6_APHCR|nr:hypothetical protein FWK35_00007014 [Aphis craccivora]